MNCILLRTVFYCLCNVQHFCTLRKGAYVGKLPTIKNLYVNYRVLYVMVLHITKKSLYCLDLFCVDPLHTVYYFIGKVILVFKSFYIDIHYINFIVHYE
jgi:hypothetical protein